MGKVFSYFQSIIATAIVLTTASCHKGGPDEPQSSRLEVSATLEDTTLPKVTIEKGDGVIDAKWQTGDAVYGFWDNNGAIMNLSYKVSDITPDGKGATFTLAGGTEPTKEGTTVYMAYTSSGSGAITFDSGGCAQLKFTAQNGTFANLAENLVFCAKAALKEKKLTFTFIPSTALVDIKSIKGMGSGESVRSIVVDSDTGMGGGVLCVKNGRLSLHPAGKALPVVINCASTDGAVWFTSCPTDMPMNFIVSSASSDGRFKEYRKCVSRPLEAGKCVDVKSLSVNESVLSGVFSVSTSHKVKFSCGNLTARRSGGTLTWGFAAKQYDKSPDGPVDVTADGDFQHFCWSTDQTGWGLCKSISDFDAIQTGQATKFMKSPLKDWTELFTGGYRTLSADEWVYVMDGREDVQDRFYKAAVGDTQGLVLLPDSFSWPEGIARPAAVMNQKGIPSVSVMYNCAEFEKIEANGAVFLPSSGIREEDQIVLVNTGVGLYRSSTYVVGYDVDYSKSLLFDDEKIVIDNDEQANRCDLWRGLCVRLVKDMAD